MGTIKARNMMERLKVYYGWAKIGNVRKKRALSVMFENEKQGCRSDRGQRVLRTIQDTIIERYQTKEEENEGRKQNRIFTEYSLFLDEKPINGSLDKCLLINSESDRNHVSKAMRDKISEALRKAFLLANPGYKEPNSQLSLHLE
ncbi:hypothetical protein [Caecibacteroides pullorum]|uniref:Uncharacterized protein n=1 Tax=Caecibacteroides pullorum TaxID=2725562 RepID=A0AA41D9I2_9BACT|nr:hypothetical protein [Caecibacteroides pullorum]MBM6856547.1 hypothetical protein [Caecibacteroides pullorum]MBV8057553.1 hypothetical protein [Caecibacteroides pullorum]